MGKKQRAKQRRIADQKRARKAEGGGSTSSTPISTSSGNESSERERLARAHALFQGVLDLPADELITCPFCHLQAFYFKMNVCAGDTSALWKMAELRSPADWAKYYLELKSGRAAGGALWDMGSVITLSLAAGTNFWRMWALYCINLLPGMTPPEDVQHIGALRPAERQLRLAEISTALWQGKRGDGSGAAPSFLYVSSVPYELKQKEDLCWYQRSSTPEVTTEKTLRTTILHTQRELLYGESHEGEEAANLEGIRVLERGLTALHRTARGRLAKWLAAGVIVGEEWLGTEENIAAWANAGQPFIVQVPWRPDFHNVPSSAGREQFEAKSGSPKWSAESVEVDANGLRHFVLRQDYPLYPSVPPRAFVTNLDRGLREASLGAICHGIAHQNLMHDYFSVDKPLPAAYFATPQHRKGYAILWYLRALLLRQTCSWLNAYDRKHKDHG